VRYSSKQNDHILPRKWTFLNSYIIWLLREHSALCREEITRKCYSTGDTIQQSVNEMIRSEVIVESKTATLSLTDRIQNLSGEVIAVEAKLTKWKSALHQALVYQRFADIVFVAMDYNGIPIKESSLDEFHINRIGLCAVGHHQIEWIILPRQHDKLQTPEREYLFTSPLARSRHTLWSRLKSTKALYQAST